MRSGMILAIAVTVVFSVVPSMAWADVWINEFHYDNASTDVGEFVEIAGPAGTDLTDWSVIGYNGSNGGYYSPNNTITLSGTIPDQQAGYGTLDFDFIPMQNGAPDGLALVDADDVLVQFISYEGVFTAVIGPANNVTSIDVGVKETSSTPAGHSLQLGGNGYKAWPHPGHFYWQSPQEETRGSVNTNQTFDPTVIELVSFTATGHGNHVALRWETATEIETAGFHLWRASGEGGDFTRITRSLIPSRGGSSWGASYVYADEGAIAGAPYAYRLEDIEYSGKSTHHDPAAVDWNSMLATDVVELSAGTGGTIHFTLDGGILNGGRFYGLFGSMSGTDPGTPLPGGDLVVPLNRDLFTEFLIRNARASWCGRFFGTLDGEGLEAAVLDIPAIPALTGLEFYFAFVLNEPWDVASNPATIQMVP